MIGHTINGCYNWISVIIATVYWVVAILIIVTFISIKGAGSVLKIEIEQGS